MTYGDLPYLQDSQRVKQPDGSIARVANNNPFLYCPVCLNEFSAHRGDYCGVPDSTPAMCFTCDSPLRLMIRETVLREVV